jgi:PEP-CTERM motif
MNTRLLLCTVAVLSLAISSTAHAQANNNPPPSGAILDLNGQPVPHGAAQTYTVDFTAAIANTAITFAFREDPAFISFSNASVVDLTHPSGNLLLNGNFASGSGSAATDWTYANIYGATFGGVVGSSQCGGGLGTCWYDGAVQAYDAISQTIATHVGDTYQISFAVSDNGPLNTFSALSTNGDTTDTGGNGIDVLAYAQAGLPPPGAVPEPSTWALMLLGFAGLGFAFRQSRRRATFA